MINVFSTTLNRYLAKTYLYSFVQVLGVILGIVYLFEVVELLRRATKIGDIPFSLVMQMGLLKLPEVGQIILPFAILFAALYTFWSLVRRHELVILRSAGISVWQFLAPVLGVSMLVGVLHMTLINPIGAMLISRYQVMEVLYLNATENMVSVSEQGLWLRQKTDDGSIILHSEKVKMPLWELSNVAVFYFGQNDNFQKRIDSKTGALKDGFWEFKDVTLNVAGKPSVQSNLEKIPTNLTLNEIEDSFSTPEETPFWSLPGYIQTMEATGFDSRKLRIHFQTLLSQPLLFAAMVIMAAAVSLRGSRAQATSFLIGSGVFIGFLVFFLSSFLKALGASDQIPVFVAAWFPAMIALALGVSVILTTEDG